MISRRLPMQSAKKSSFGDLVRYITDSQGKSERVAGVEITNCESQDLRWAIGEVLATQQINTRSQGDKTYHLLISFAPGETPSAEVRRDVEERLCAAMGYRDHQRISAVHTDTDAMHIHVAINKIHPTRHTIHEPYRDFQTRSAMCAKLEVEHDLVRVSHSGKKHLSENRADDMEQHSGLESLISWVRRECLQELKAAKSWDDLHLALRENGLQIRERGNGLIVESHNGIVVKASSIDRALSKGKLEERLGGFEGWNKKVAPKVPVPLPGKQKPGIGKVGKKPPAHRRNGLRSIQTVETLKLDRPKRYTKSPKQGSADTELYAKFREELTAVVDARRLELASARSNKARLIEEAKRVGRFRRAAIKLMGESALNKRLMYALASKALKDRLKEIHSENDKTVSRVNAKYKVRTWLDWLQAKASEGNHDALVALRGRGVSRGAKTQTFAPKEAEGASSYTPKVTPKQPGYSKADAQRLGAFEEDALSFDQAKEARAAVPVPIVQDHITKEGTVIYRAGTSAIRDDGAALQLSRGTTRDGVETALRMAVARYGREIRVTGSEQFKELVARTAAQRNLSITFDDPALEARRQHLHKILHQENGNERREQPDRRRTDSAGTGRDGSGNAQQRSTRAATRASTGRPGVSTGVGPGLESRGTEHSTGAGVGSSGRRSVAVRPVTGWGVSKHRAPGDRRKPPTQAENGLREMQELGVVQHPNRAEGLLSGHVHGGMEQQGNPSNDELRRNVPGRGVRGTEAGGDAGAQEGANPAKPGIGRVGMKPPAFRRNRLRPFSSLQELKSEQASREAMKTADAPISGVSAAPEVASDLAKRPATGAQTAPGIGRVGMKPPAFRRNRLRPFSSLHELKSELASREAVKAADALKKGDVSAAPEVASDLTKRPITGGQAARAYIQEREEKRVKGFDIPKHRLYNQQDAGAMEYAGVRQVEGHSMALLRRTDEILVLPIDAATARRIKRLKLGDQISVTEKGAVKSKGRSR